MSTVGLIVSIVVCSCVGHTQQMAGSSRFTGATTHLTQLGAIQRIALGGNLLDKRLVTGGVGFIGLNLASELVEPVKRQKLTKVALGGAGIDAILANLGNTGHVSASIAALLRRWVLRMQ